MSRIEVSAWVAQSFVRSTSALGATASRAHLDDACTEFIGLWSTPGRHFHDTRHLVDVLTHVDRLAPEAQNADVVRLAAWGHGCMFSTGGHRVYTRHGGVDRTESARVSAEIFRALGIADDIVNAVSSLIVGMDQRSSATPESGVFEAEDVDLLVLGDAHLGFLTSQPQKYRTYVAALRAEYAHMSALDFVEPRLDEVTRLLQRKRLFATPLAADWDVSARQNLESEKARLLAELAGMQVTDGEQEGVAADVDSVADSVGHTDAERSTRPNVAPSQAVYGGSSLEEPAEHVEPGSPSRVLTLEQAKQARRDDIARVSRERIER